MHLFFDEEGKQRSLEKSAPSSQSNKKQWRPGRQDEPTPRSPARGKRSQSEHGRRDRHRSRSRCERRKEKHGGEKIEKKHKPERRVSIKIEPDGEDQNPQRSSAVQILAKELDETKKLLERERDLAQQRSRELEEARQQCRNEQRIGRERGREIEEAKAQLKDAQWTDRNQARELEETKNLRRNEQEAAQEQAVELENARNLLQNEQETSQEQARELGRTKKLLRKAEKRAEKCKRMVQCQSPRECTDCVSLQERAQSLRDSIKGAIDEFCDADGDLFPNASHLDTEHAGELVVKVLQIVRTELKRRNDVLQGNSLVNERLRKEFDDMRSRLEKVSRRSKRRRKLLSDSESQSRQLREQNEELKLQIEELGIQVDDLVKCVFGCNHDFLPANNTQNSSNAITSASNSTNARGPLSHHRLENDASDSGFWSASERLESLHDFDPNLESAAANGAPDSPVAATEEGHKVQIIAPADNAQQLDTADRQIRMSHRLVEKMRRDLQAEIDRLKSELRTLHGQHAEQRDQSTATIAELRHELERTCSELVAAKEPLACQNCVEIEEYWGPRVADFEDLTHDAQIRAQNAEQECKDLRKARKASETELENFKSKHAKLEQDYAKLLVDSRDINERLDAMARQLSTAEENHLNAQQECEKSKQTEAALIARNRELKDQLDKVARQEFTLIATNYNLEEQIKDKNSQLETAEDGHSRRQDVEDEELESAFNSFRTKCEDLRSLQREMEIFQRRCAAEEKMKEDLLGSNHALTEQLIESAQRLDIAEDNYSRAQRDCERLEAAFELSRSKFEDFKKLQEELSTYQRRCRELEDAKEERRCSTPDQESKAVGNFALVRLLRTKLETTRKLHEETKKNEEQLRNSKVDLQKALDTAKSRSSAAEHRCESASVQYERLQNQLRSSQAEHDETSNIVMQLRNSNHDLQKGLDEAIVRFNDAESKYTQAHVDCRRYQEELATLKREMEQQSHALGNSQTAECKEQFRSVSERCAELGNLVPELEQTEVCLLENKERLRTSQARTDALVELAAGSSELGHTEDQPIGWKDHFQNLCDHRTELESASFRLWKAQAESSDRDDQSKASHARLAQRSILAEVNVKRRLPGIHHLHGQSLSLDGHAESLLSCWASLPQDNADSRPAAHATTNMELLIQWCAFARQLELSLRWVANDARALQQQVDQKTKTNLGLPVDPSSHCEKSATEISELRSQVKREQEAAKIRNEILESRADDLKCEVDRQRVIAESAREDGLKTLQVFQEREVTLIEKNRQLEERLAEILQDSQEKERRLHSEVAKLGDGMATDNSVTATTSPTLPKELDEDAPVMAATETIDMVEVRPKSRDDGGEAVVETSGSLPLDIPETQIPRSVDQSPKAGVEPSDDDTIRVLQRVMFPRKRPGTTNRVVGSAPKRKSGSAKNTSRGRKPKIAEWDDDDDNGVDSRPAKQPKKGARKVDDRFSVHSDHKWPRRKAVPDNRNSIEI